MNNLRTYFSRGDIVLWSSSVFLIIISFCIFDRESYLTLCASLIGVTSLIFNAKGNPFGQLLMVIFSLLDIRYVSVIVCFVAFLFNDIYGYISWKKMKIRQEQHSSV